MQKIDKIKGEASGYIAIMIWVILFILCMASLSFDIHFKGDIFVITFLILLTFGFRETYLQYRYKEIIEREELEN